MSLLLVSLLILAGSGFLALVGQSKPRFASIVGASGTVIGSALGLFPAFRILLGGSPESMHWAWAVPYGSFYLEVDALSAFFLIPILVLSAVAAVYGVEYVKPWESKRALGPAWLFFNLLVGSMVLVVLARNAVLFLMAWEVMALSSFFLVTFEDEKESVREAGWLYLVATHWGTAFLLVLFLMMGHQAGSMDFDRWTQLGARTSGTAGLFFILAVIGFGTKAGFMPFHVWLPEAHPAAPSHVSALMSGVMIKTGIYGIYRLLLLLGPPPLWWGWVMIGIGLTSGILGVLFALAQHDLKRLLAYHSVENIGIIALGLGLGLVGLSLRTPVLALLGFGGSLLHVLNHALFKGLLFLGAGSVLHATATREIDHLGGLLKRMPWTAALFLVGAVAISGLPPLNGFVSEIMIFVGAYQGLVQAASSAAVPALGVIAGLALIGGLAVACFTKAFGIVFLGEPRSDHAMHAHESGWGMRLSMIVLALGCVFIGLGGPLAVGALQPLLVQLTHLSPEVASRNLHETSAFLTLPVIAMLVFLALVVMLVLFRLWLLASRKVESGPTWDCGYALPTPRMQYTASSFAQPLTSLFNAWLSVHKHTTLPVGHFPAQASLATETPDLCHANLYRPAFVKMSWGLSKLRWLQQGRVQVYVLYIALTLLALLVWKLR